MRRVQSDDFELRRRIRHQFDLIQLVYNDLRAEYGESNRIVTATLPVGTVVLKLVDRP